MGGKSGIQLELSHWTVVLCAILMALVEDTAPWAPPGVIRCNIPLETAGRISRPERSFLVGVGRAHGGAPMSTFDPYALYEGG